MRLSPIVGSWDAPVLVWGLITICGVLPFLFIPGPSHELLVWNRVDKYYLKGLLGKYPCKLPSLSGGSRRHHCYVEAAIVRRWPPLLPGSSHGCPANEGTWLCASRTLFTQILGWIYLTGCSLPTSGLEGKAGSDQVIISGLQLSLSWRFFTCGGRWVDSLKLSAEA